MVQVFGFAFLLAAGTILQPGAAYPAEREVLAGVFEPEAIKIAAGELYIVERASVLVYSLRDDQRTLYFIRDDEATEEWELHAVEIR